MFRHLLVATNGSPLSLIAIRDGVELARVCHARITFIACSPPGAGAESVAGERVQQGCDLAAAAGVPATRVQVVTKQPWEGILETADREHCDLIVMASRGHRAIAGLLLGSQTLNVLTKSKRAVLVCASREAGFAIRHVLAPTDGGEASAEAVRTAVELAAVAGARLALLTCTKPVLAYAEEDEQARYEEESSDTASERLAPGERYARERRVPVAIEHLHAAHPHKAISEYAQRHGCDLVVMASRGRKDAISFVLASETLNVLTHATLPVLVVRGDPPPR